MHEAIEYDWPQPVTNRFLDQKDKVLASDETGHKCLGVNAASHAFPS